MTKLIGMILIAVSVSACGAVQNASRNVIENQTAECARSGGVVDFAGYNRPCDQEAAKQKVAAK